SIGAGDDIGRLESDGRGRNIMDLNVVHVLLDGENAGPGVAEAAGVEFEGGGIEPGDAAGGRGNGPGVCGGAVKVGRVAGDVAEGERNQVNIEFAGGGGADGERAGDVQQIPARVGAGGAGSVVDFPGIGSAAIPGFV